MSKTIQIKKMALARNQRAAEQNRVFFQQQRLLVCNMISSPGSGKTSLLEQMGGRHGRRLAVINGDVQMSYDAERIEKSGAHSVQIETGGSCHLTAEMVQKALESITLAGVEFLIIENVGNLVCPSGFDLGEHLKIAMVSVTEGDEKPIKYPSLFSRAQAVIINKIDLLPFVDFNPQRVENDCYKLNASMRLFKISCKNGEGLGQWFSFLEEQRHVAYLSEA